MRRAHETLTKITGQTPLGVRVPSWDFSLSTLKLIRELRLLYDSSLMADDEPCELLQDGQPIGVVELPVEWIKDDAPYFGMNRASGLRPYTAPSAVLEIFKAEFDGAVAERGLFLLTMHPHITGHRSRMWVLEALIEHMKRTASGSRPTRKSRATARRRHPERNRTRACRAILDTLGVTLAGAVEPTAQREASASRTPRETMRSAVPASDPQLADWRSQ